MTEPRSTIVLARPVGSWPRISVALSMRSGRRRAGARLGGRLVVAAAARGDDARECDDSDRGAPLPECRSCPFSCLRPFRLTLSRRPLTTGRGLADGGPHRLSGTYGAALPQRDVSSWIYTALHPKDNPRGSWRRRVLTRVVSICALRAAETRVRGGSVDAGQPPQLGVHRRVEGGRAMRGDRGRDAFVGAVDRRLAPAGRPGAVRPVDRQGGPAAGAACPPAEPPEARQVEAGGDARARARASRRRAPSPRS